MEQTFFHANDVKLVRSYEVKQRNHLWRRRTAKGTVTKSITTTIIIKFQVDDDRTEQGGRWGLVAEDLAVLSEFYRDSLPSSLRLPPRLASHSSLHRHCYASPL